MYRTRRSIPTLVVAALVVAACGDDDGSSTPSAVDPPPAETADGPGDASDGAEDASDAASGDPGATGEPSSFLADELHPIALPEPGTVVVTLAGETYVLDNMIECRISDALEGRLGFEAIATGVLPDGSQTRAQLSRSVVDLEATTGSWHERDYLQMTVEQEPGGGLFSNAWHDSTRDVPGGPVSGDGDVLPLIYVVDDGTTISATAIAEVSHPPFTGEYDRAGEGLAEFAVVCD